MAEAARTKSFRDENGNRMIFPSLIIYPDIEDSPWPSDVILRGMSIGFATGLSMEDEWLVFDPARFPHIRSIAQSRGFLHGGATVLLFAGPEFDSASCDRSGEADETALAGSAEGESAVPEGETPK